MDSRLYWIWLQQAVPLGSPVMGDLLDAFGSAAGIYEADEAALAAAEVRGNLLRRLSDKAMNTPHRILDRVLQDGDWVLTPEDALYPLCLRHISGFPAALYGRGILPDLDSTPAITVVGTRHASEQGRREAQALAAGLAAGGMVVVSGGAVGIDAAVHAGALLAGGRTVAVMACPLNENYPAPNEALRQQIVQSGGLLLSEYAPGEPYRCDFHVRNRLLMGLSQGVCLAETPARSGARITARLAREQGRDVYAMPGALTGHHYDGAHKEIQGGAALVIRATDILREYAPQFPGMLDLEAAEEAQKAAERVAMPTAEKTPPKKREKRSRRQKEKKEITTPTTDSPSPATATCPAEASAAARQVFEVLTGQPMPVDDLAAAAAMPIPAVLAALTELEMFGCAANSAGGQYRRLG